MKNTKAFDEILLRRKNKLNIKANVDSKNDNLGRVLCMIKNIEPLGYTFSKSLIEYMRRITVDEQNEVYLELVSCLKEYVGADKVWTPMYPNFPSQVQEMKDWELFVNAIVHYLSGGTLVPAYEKDERLPLFESPNLTVLDQCEDTELDILMNNLITSKTSLSATDKEDMIWLMQNNGLDYAKLPDEIPFKENVAVIAKLIIDNKAEPIWFNVLSKYIKTATDVLRLAVYLSGGDVSLKEAVKFKKMPRNIRRLIMRLLENCNNIEEDMLRYKMPWIRFGEILHPGENKYKKYVKVQTAFYKLRHNEKIETFGGKVDAAIQEGNLIKAVELLQNRPGELARMLDSLLRKDSSLRNTYNVIKTFEEVANKVSVPVLLQVREHFAWRNSGNNCRVFFPKGNVTKAYTIKNDLIDLHKNDCDVIVDICETAIIDQFKAKSPMNKVYIADCMKNYCIPQSQRSASKALKNVTRGSRFKINDDANFIRLGIHWMNEMYKGFEQRTDIDLSCSFLDENFGSISHVSWTGMRNGYAWHSGDLVNAPRDKGGSAEFIDIDINQAMKAGVKYAAVQVYCYTDTDFCDLDDALFNWQEGVDKNCGDIFEPSRVQQSMNLGCDSNCEIPVIFDLEKREVVWCDLALTTKASFPRCVEGNIKGISATVMGIVQAHKPNMYDLAFLNAKAAGIIVTDRNDADVIFDTNLTKPVVTITKYIEVQNENGEVINTRIETEEKVKDCRIISPWDLDVWYSEMM